MTGQLVAPEPDVADPARTYRYPGPSPFADDEIARRLFRGRAPEIDHVLHTILSVDLLLVYARSGAGKTSLLAAGVLEELRERGYFPVMLRLDHPGRAPAELIDDQIRKAAEKTAGVTVTRHPNAPEALVSSTPLWDLLSGLEAWRGNTLQRLVLVFDQFEELFTLWQDDQRGEFIEQLGQVVRGHRPRPAADALYLPPPDAKIVLVIREDFLGELETLADHIPQILQHRFRLDGLSVDQATAAIREPAALEDPRLRQPFGYSEAAATAIVEFLQPKDEHGRPMPTRRIDPSQLQIICEHVERTILPRKTDGPGEGAVVEISADDLAGARGLELILSAFYRTRIAELPRGERRAARSLCESGLINRQGRRLSLEKDEIIREYKVAEATLDALTERRLLRAEPRVDSYYYELAHDSLTRPILEYRDEVRAKGRRRWLIAGLICAGLAALAMVIVLVLHDSDDSPSCLLSSGCQSIVIGESITGEIDGSNPSAAYQLAAPQDTAAAIEPRPDQQALVTVEPSPDLDVVLQVTDANGRSEFVDWGGNGAPEVVLVDSAHIGETTVIVSGSRNTTDSYRLTVSPVAGTVVEIGGTIDGEIDASNPFAVYQLATPQDTGATVEFGPDQQVLVTVDPSPDLDVVLQVTDANGRSEFVDWGGNDAPEVVLVDSAHIVETTLIVRSGKDDTSGTYRLIVSSAKWG